MASCEWNLDESLRKHKTSMDKTCIIHSSPFWQFLGVFSLHACVPTCVFVCVFSCFTCVHAPRGETGCVGCYLPLQRVTANHQPWQTLGESGGGRMRETRWRWVWGLAFEFHWVTTESFGFCHHDLGLSLNLCWTTAQPPNSPLKLKNRPRKIITIGTRQHKRPHTTNKVSIP